MPILLTLIPLLAQVVPEFVHLLGGDQAGETAQKVADAVQAVAGTVEPEAAKTALEDPAKVSELRVTLAKIAAEAQEAHEATILAEIQARVADTQSARAMASTKGLMQYVAALLAVTVCAAEVSIQTGFFHPTADSAGYIHAAFGVIMAFFYGSNRSSEMKTEMLFNSAPIQGGGPQRPLGR